MRGLPFLGVLMMHRSPSAPACLTVRWVAPRATEMISAFSPISLRCSSVTSPNLNPHHAEIRMNALNLGSIFSAISESCSTVGITAWVLDLHAACAGNLAWVRRKQTLSHSGFEDRLE